MLFAALPEPLQDELRDGARPAAIASGQIIQQRGDTADGFYLIEEGSVSVGQFLPDGEFRAVAVLGPGDSWGELAMFAHRPRVVDAIARSRAVVRHIRESAFEAALRDDPAASRALLGALSTQLQELLDVTASIRSGSAKARVAGLLVTLAGGEDLGAPIALSQQEFGELLGLSRATVNAALRDYEARGLVVRQYGKIELQIVPDQFLLRIGQHG